MATWGIHHTSLSVSDAEASLKFYRDGLGLKLDKTAQNAANALLKK
jgi:catechol 2,3-dioxygenase-like lactoylglutathione lyase family enzyme